MLSHHFTTWGNGEKLIWPVTADKLMIVKRSQTGLKHFVSIMPHCANMQNWWELWEFLYWTKAPCKVDPHGTFFSLSVAVIHLLTGLNVTQTTLRSAPSKRFEISALKTIYLMTAQLPCVRRLSDKLTDSEESCRALGSPGFNLWVFQSISSASKAEEFAHSILTWKQI